MSDDHCESRHKCSIPTMAGFEECRSGVCGYEPDEPEIADDFAEFIANEVAERPDFVAIAESATNATSALTMDQVLDMIDSGRAAAEDPSDDFTAVDIDGVRWEFEDATETCRPVQ